MPENISWSLTAGSSGGSMDDSGGVDVDAVTAASVRVDAASSADLSFQLGGIDKVEFLAVKSDRYSSDLKLKATGADAMEFALEGPLVLHGDAVSLLNGTLETLSVTNDDPSETVEIQVLLGRTLTA